MAAALRRTQIRLRVPRPSFSTTADAAAPATFPVPEPDPISRAKSAIRSESDPERIASLFLSSVHSPKFYGDRAIYKLSISKLARSHRHDLIERLLEPHLAGSSSTSDANPNPKSEGFHIRIITLYSEAGMIDHAVRAFRRIPDSGLRYTERSLCAILTAFRKNRKHDLLLKTFQSAPEDLQISPGITSHNFVLNALCTNGDVAGARKMLDEMERKGTKPDLVSYNTLLTGYLKKGEESGFDDVLKEMVAKGLAPSVVTYNCRIGELCWKKRTSEAEELLDAMASKGVRPNRGTFNAIIDGFFKEGDVVAAMRVFKRMPRAKKEDGHGGASPNFDTYVLLIRSLVEKGEFLSGLEVFKECLDRKWAPPFKAVKGLVEGLKKEAQFNDAEYVVVKMRKAVKGDAVDAWKKVEGALSV
ncbi:pentatricopeptide repeat-containing protein-like, mitochondrial [Iris pallida]|uniref:Pentatricopeptide repeat-containing protein-like, mitochondrial n=1 Tax=Iris pallida TaxID=29817 RepID=A0AAX6H3U3_IRIPA|nr:pentatricopeptide repeat-containing protein-like, mitochondrial [Iris pallida]